MFGPGDPNGPIDVWDVSGLHPIQQVGRVEGVGDDWVIKPGGWCQVFASICPLFIIVGDFGGVDCMCPIKQIIEFIAFWICEGVDCNVGAGGIA